MHVRNELLYLTMLHILRQVNTGDEVNLWSQSEHEQLWLSKADSIVICLQLRLVETTNTMIPIARNVSIMTVCNSRIYIWYMRSHKLKKNTNAISLHADDGIIFLLVRSKLLAKRRIVHPPIVLILSVLKSLFHTSLGTYRVNSSKPCSLCS